MTEFNFIIFVLCSCSIDENLHVLVQVSIKFNGIDFCLDAFRLNMLPPVSCDLIN